MKKLLTLCLAAAFLFTACGTKKEKSLYVQGLELIALMGEMAQSDAYFSMYSTVPEVKAQMDKVARAAEAGIYQNPKAVYQITADPDGLMELLKNTSGADADFDRMPPELKAYAQSRLFSSCASILNSTAGMESIAASSIYTCSKSFVCHEASEDTAYLYTYEDACPVLVTFSAGENYAVNASGTYILNEDMENPESLAGVFGLSGFRIKELKIP